uniref:C2H2-type domain-containing protein n=1 Tax=Strongyloides venezuelensis TaxID=75913 RepID=A0A0K0FJ46_STRVS
MSKIICSICGSKFILFNNITKFKEHVHTIHKCGRVTIGKLSFKCAQSFYRTLTSDNCNCKNTGIFTFTSILRHYRKMHDFGSPENNSSHEVISITNEININNDENLYDSKNINMNVDKIGANIKEATNEILNNLRLISGSAIEFARIQATITKCGFTDEFQEVLEPISTQYKREQYFLKKKVFIKTILIVSEMNDLIDNDTNVCVDDNIENFAVRFLTFSSNNLEFNQSMGFFY